MASLQAGHVWAWPAVEEWAEATGRSEYIELVAVPPIRAEWPKDEDERDGWWWRLTSWVGPPGEKRHERLLAIGGVVIMIGTFTVLTIFNLWPGS